MNGLPVEFECRSSVGLVTEKKENEKWILLCSVVVVVAVVVVAGVLNRRNIPNLNLILSLNLIN